VAALDWDNLQMIKVNKVEQLQADSGVVEKENTAQFLQEIMIQCKLKTNFETYKTKPLEVLKDLLCKKSLRLNVCKNIDPNESPTPNKFEPIKKFEELTSGISIWTKWQIK